MLCTVSSFFSKGKAKWFDAWMAMSDDEKEQLISLFVKLVQTPKDFSVEDREVLYSYACIVYSGKRSQSTNWVSNRLDQFMTMKDPDIRKLMPSKGALVEHIKRAIYQVGFIWREAVLNIDLPDPSQFGWKQDNDDIWCPRWEPGSSDPKSFDVLVTLCSCKLAKC